MWIVHELGYYVYVMTPLTREVSMMLMLLLLCHCEDNHAHTHSMHKYEYDMSMVSIERLILICTFTYYDQEDMTMYARMWIWMLCNDYGSVDMLNKR